MKKPNQAKFVGLLMDLTNIAQMTQRDIAQQLDVGENYISRVKRGAEPSARLVLALEHIHKENFSQARGEDLTVGEESTKYGSPAERILGDNLHAAALNEAQKRHFQDVSDYLRYLVRQDLERPQARETSLSDVARAAANLLKNDLDSARRMAGDDNEN